MGVTAGEDSFVFAWGRSRMSRTEKLDVRGILISRSLEHKEISIQDVFKAMGDIAKMIEPWTEFRRCN